MSIAKKYPLDSRPHSPSSPTSHDSHTMRVGRPQRPPLESGPLPIDRHDPHDEWSESTLDMFPGENDGDRHTPLLFDSLITPIFPESAVREVMARAEAMERAAAQSSSVAQPLPHPSPLPLPLPTAPAPTPVVWPKAAPVVESWKADTPVMGVRVRLPAATLVQNADDDDVDPPTALHVVAGRGHHVSWMFYVAMALLLALLTATVCKAAKKLSLHEVNSAGSGQISV